MLKKTLFLALAMLMITSMALASGHKIKMFGTVCEVNPQANTMSIQTDDGKIHKFTVDARSEFEVEYRDHTKHDQDIPFSDLKVGEKVKVKAYNGPAPQVIDDVEVYR